LCRLVPTFFFGTVSLRVGLCRAVFCLIGSESFLGTNMLRQGERSERYKRVRPGERSERYERLRPGDRRQRYERVRQGERSERDEGVRQGETG
jgi:hypothetical protein